MRRFCAILSALLCLSVLSARAGGELVKGKTLRLEKTDYLDLALYNWPRTLLSYDLSFSPGISGEEELVLTDEKTHSRIPFQLSEPVRKQGKIISAKLLFFASLPSGGSFSYSLKYGSGAVETPQYSSTLTRLGNCVVLSNGLIEVSLSDGLRIRDLESKTEAHSRLNTGSRTLARTEVIPGETGPLVSDATLVLHFDGGASHTLHLKAVSGYPFIILDEKVEGIGKEDEVWMDIEWDNFEAKYRFASMWDRTVNKKQPWLPVDKPIYTNYSKEDPFWTGQGTIEDPSDRMLFRLASFGGNSVREQVPVISFWGDGPRELGVFVYDHDKWDDRQWGIWQQTPDISVYFRYKDKKIHYLYPVVSGSRSTALALYDKASGEGECAAFVRKLDAMGGQYRSTNVQFRRVHLLHSQYSLLSLDRVKDWELEYPEKYKRNEMPFVQELGNTGKDRFLKEIRTSAMAYYMMGLNGYPGIHSIAHRPYYGRLVQGFQTNYALLSPVEQKQADALMLLAGYVNMLEAMNAIRTCLAGTANMASDGWAVPGFTAAIFPEHPMAGIWKDFFEKCLEIYGIFYTRPDVKAYESLGGRWAESIGIYNWAYFKPTLTAQIALSAAKERNCFPSDAMAQRGRWMVDMLTAPVMVKRKHESEEYLQRVYTAHGAHSGGRFVDRFAAVYQVGKFLENYDPLTAEHLYWCGNMGVAQEGKRGDSEWESAFKKRFDSTNSGTNPHLKSEKYTGHGIVLRSGVDTEEELSIHLDQVDKGPNYRWGNQGDGNSGGIYFYAGGKIWSGHENESAGDHTQNDVDNVCNFGVMKDGRFQTVGYNELTQPLFDLGIAQFASVCSVPEPGMSSWPEYESRSVMLAGTDYFLIFDKSATNWRACNRFSWFVHKEDRIPNIIFLSGVARRDHWTTAATFASHGFYRDAIGSQLTLVSHKDGIRPLGGTLVHPDALPQNETVWEFKPARNAAVEEGVYEIQAPGSTDIVFCHNVPISVSKNYYSFSGEAGLARKMKNGEIHLALFSGSRIVMGGKQLELSAEKPCAVALSFRGSSYAKGCFKNYGQALLRVGGLSGGRFFIDGCPVAVSAEGIVLPEGQHSLEYTAGDAIPLPSLIADTEHTKGGCHIWIDRPAGVLQVAVEVSSDGGKTWEEQLRTSGTDAVLKLKKGKCHVRAVSLNGSARADSAPEYPVYVDGEAPHFPEGVRLLLSDGSVKVQWGKVLGTGLYRLYRKDPGANEYHLVYEGRDRFFEDRGLRGVTVCDAAPSDLPLDRPSGKFYSYYVVSVNERGASKPSHVVDTDPGSWANWYPATPLRFKRRSAFWMPPYVSERHMPPMYYPE